MRRLKRTRPQHKGKKGLPLWFLWTIIVLLIYAAISNWIVFTTDDITLLRPLVTIAIAITMIWFITNIYLTYYFRTHDYITKAWAFCLYYAILNGLNLAKIIFRIPLDQKSQFIFQIITKIFELCIVIPALVQYYKGKKK